MGEKGTNDVGTRERRCGARRWADERMPPLRRSWNNTFSLIIPRVQCVFLRTCSTEAEKTHAPRVRVEFVRLQSSIVKGKQRLRNIAAQKPTRNDHFSSPPLLSSPQLRAGDREGGDERLI